MTHIRRSNADRVHGHWLLAETNTSSPCAHRLRRRPPAVAMGQTMATNRAFLLACATVAILSLTSVCSTRADAKPCHTEDSTPRQERSCLIRSTMRSVMAEVAKQAATAKQPAMEKQSAAEQAAKAKRTEAKQAAIVKEAATGPAAAKPM